MGPISMEQTWLLVPFKIWIHPEQTKLKAAKFKYQRIQVEKDL